MLKRFRDWLWSLKSEKAQRLDKEKGFASVDEPQDSPTKRLNHGDNDSDNKWWKNPIGILGLTVSAGIIVWLAIQLMRPVLGA